MQWGAFLLALAWPLVKKVLVSLGIGFVTYTGLTMIANQIKDQVMSAWGLAGANVVQVLTIAGIPQSVGITLGGLAAGAALAAAARLGKIS